MTRGEKVGAIIGKDIACLNSWSPERRRWCLIGDHIVLPTGGLRDTYGERDPRVRKNRHEDEYRVATGESHGW